MAKISATILTYNEERRIEACLESLHDIADEIIVVDSNSTDGTAEICRRHGCKVTTRPMSGFGAQRQYATSLTTHPYVLAIDADEILSPTLRASLLKLKQEGFAHRVYSMSRLNFYCGYAVRHCGWYPDIEIRLFDKRYANWNLHDVHEKVTFRDSVTPELLEGDLLHYRCDTPMEYDRKQMKLSEVKRNRLIEQNRSIGVLRPTINGLRAFFSTYLRQGGILDGSVGLHISRQDYFKEKNAYGQARRHIAANKKR